MYSIGKMNGSGYSMLSIVPSLVGTITLVMVSRYGGLAVQHNTFIIHVTYMYIYCTCMFKTCCMHVYIVGLFVKTGD